MSRKDTIIIAVLMNAALLSLLFILASRGGSEKEEKGPLTYREMKTNPSTAYPTQTFDLNPPNLPSLIAMEETVGNESAFESSFPLDETYTPKKKQAPKDTPKAPPKALPDNQKTSEITVKKGDSLDKIAKANGSTVEAIIQANGLKNSKIDVGDVLQVPVLKEPKVAPVKTPPAPPANVAATPTPKDKGDDPSVQYYTVKKGDNPWKIAKQFHMRYGELLKLNDLDEKKAKNMQVGDQIKVQAGTPPVGH